MKTRRPISLDGSIATLRPAHTPRRRSQRGTVLIIVLVTLVFASVALITFMDKATNDLLVDHREAQAQRLRMEAYSALETTLGVLVDFQQTLNGLHSPMEGWSDPLGFAGYTPSEGRTVDVAFEDESGKISLPHADQPTLTRLFESWDVAQPDAEMLADALMGWMHKEHVYSTPISPDYEQSAIPYDPPLRPLRTYDELAAIDKVREFFFDANGRPNDYYRRFVDSVSLLDFAQSNINGAAAGTLASVGQYTESQRQAMNDYLTGHGQYQNNGPGYFRDTGQAQALVGEGGNSSAFSTTISALRIIITVHEGKTQFRVAAVVTTSGSAKVVQETATSQKTETSSPTSQNQPNNTSPNAAQPKPAVAGNGTQPSTTTENLRYPFTLLEIRENDEIAPTPLATPTTS
jgi:general secretion pathway protein K